MRLLSLDPWKTQYVFEIKPRVDKVTSLFIDRFPTDLCPFFIRFRPNSCVFLRSMDTAYTPLLVW